MRMHQNIILLLQAPYFGIAINREKYSFPVGKVQMINMYPLSFKEFLIALSRKDLVEEIENHFNTNETNDSNPLQK